MKQKERFVWAIALISLLGWIVVDKNEGDFTDRGTDSGSRKDSVRRSGNHSPSASMDGLRERPGRGSAGQVDVAARGSHALRSDDPLRRMADFLQALSSSDSESLGKFRATMTAMKSEGRLLPAEEALLEYKAGQLEGASLLAGRTGSAEDFSEVDTIRKQLEGWASADPAAAAGWLEALPAGKYRDQLTVSYLAAAAKHDPAGSMQLVASLHPSQQAAAGVATAKALAASSSADEFTGILAAMEQASGNMGEGYLSAMFDTLVAGSETDSALIAENNLEKSFVTVNSLSRISLAKAKSDPVGALNWAASIEDRKSGLNQGDLLAAAVGGMNLQGLNHAEEWAAAHWGQEGVDKMWAEVLRNRNVLENRGDDANEYDKDD